MAQDASRSVRHLGAAPEAVVLVCRKCSKRMGGGFGPDGKQRLAKALRRTVPKAKPRRARMAVLEVECLDLCPKGAVVALRGDRPGDWVLVPRGTPLVTVAAHLGLPVAADQEA